MKSRNLGRIIAAGMLFSVVCSAQAMVKAQRWNEETGEKKLSGVYLSSNKPSLMDLSKKEEFNCPKFRNCFWFILIGVPLAACSGGCMILSGFWAHRYGVTLGRY